MANTTKKKVVSKKNDTCEDAPSAFSKLNPWLKFALLILTIAGIIGGGIWQFNSTYATKEALASEAKHAAEQRQLIAEESVKTFQLYRQQIIQQQKSSQLEYWQQMLNNSYNEAMLITNQLAKDPNNQYLKQRLQNEQNNQALYRTKINELMRQ